MADDTVKIDFSPPESKCQQIQKKKKKSREEVGKRKNRPKKHCWNDGFNLADGAY